MLPDFSSALLISTLFFNLLSRTGGVNYSFVLVLKPYGEANILRVQMILDVNAAGSFPPKLT